jgi:hypothetical protein
MNHNDMQDGKWINLNSPCIRLHVLWRTVSLYCNCKCFLLCAMLLSVLCGPVHVCNYVRFKCLFAFTAILILFTVTTLWTCPISFCNDLWMKYNTIQFTNWQVEETQNFVQKLTLVWKLTSLCVTLNSCKSVPCVFELSSKIMNLWIGKIILRC